MTTSTTTRTAVWNFSIVGLHKVIQTIGSFAFVLIIPNMLGTTYFGQFGFLMSLFIIATRMGDLGMEDILVSFIPKNRANNQEEDSKKIIGSLLTLRVFLGLLAGLGAVMWAFAITDWLSLTQGVVVGLTIWLYVIALLPFEVLLGLGRINQWIINYSWRQVAMILTIWLLFAQFDLGFSGVVYALFFTQIFFISLGFWWIKDYVSFAHLNFNWVGLKSHLSTGFVFFLANTCMVLIHRSGTQAIQAITDNTTLVSFFDLGSSVYLMIFLSITQAMMSLLPLASELHATGKTAEVARWFGLLQRFGVVAAVGITGAIWGFAPVLAESVFGPGFGPTGQVMGLVILALVPMMLGYPAGMLAVVWKEPKIRLWAGFWGLLVTISGMIGLISIWGVYGASLALVLGITVYAGAIWFLVRHKVSLAWGKGLLGCLFGLVYLPLWWLPETPLVTFTQIVLPVFTGETAYLISRLMLATLATLITSIIYLGLVFGGNVISVREIRIIGQTLLKK